MRITGGIARGIPLALPQRGEIRPATDYIREAVFSSLGDLPEDARVLDVFAGTGAYALEAVSRGARFACLVDKNPAASVVQKKNFSAVRKSLEASAAPVPALEFLSLDLMKEHPFPATFPLFDLIFCDPPWALWQNAQIKILGENLAARIDPATPWARIILEAPSGFEPPIPQGWELAKRIGKKGKDQPVAGVLKRISPPPRA